MGDNREKSTSSSTRFTSAMTLSQMRVPHVPNRFVQPLSQRPNMCLDSCNTLPIIDLSYLHHSSLRSKIVFEVGLACQGLGVFQVINHGIPALVINDALEMAQAFFNLPEDKKMHLVSDNIHNPVRYGTSINHSKDTVHYWRDFIKHYCHPLSTWIHQWPSNPPTYKDKKGKYVTPIQKLQKQLMQVIFRHIYEGSQVSQSETLETMGSYATAMQQLQKQLMQVIFESLGLKLDYLKKDVQKGSQVMAVNCYPACPEPELAMGMPPHSDYGTITILTQNQKGLQIKDHDNNWLNVPVSENSLVVHIGDQLEVMSNGKYKSVFHRAILNTDKNRISIASLHSMGLEKKVGPVPDLLNEEEKAAYREGSFGEFLDYIHSNDIAKRGRYIDTLKKET